MSGFSQFRSKREDLNRLSYVNNKTFDFDSFASPNSPALNLVQKLNLTNEGRVISPSIRGNSTHYK